MCWQKWRALIYPILGYLIYQSKVLFNPLMPTVAFNICCPIDCVSRHNGGTAGALLKPLRDDSALRALSSLRGAPEVPPLCRETQSLGQQMYGKHNICIYTYTFRKIFSDHYHNFKYYFPFSLIHATLYWNSFEIYWRHRTLISWKKNVILDKPIKFLNWRSFIRINGWPLR